jgi:hypothetical protein
MSIAFDAARRAGEDGSVGWLSRVFRRAGRQPLDGRDARRIIEAYAGCLERHGLGRRYGRERELPYSKETIGRALLLALRFSSGPETAEPLREGFVDLERFLSDDEYAVVEDYGRRATSGRAEVSLESMGLERREAALRVLEAIDGRRARRRQLLAILETERRDGEGTDGCPGART